MKSLKDIKFFYDDDSDLICEDTKYICEIPGELIQIIKNISGFGFIKNIDIKSGINPNWEYYDKLTRFRSFICY